MLTFIIVGTLGLIFIAVGVIADGILDFFDFGDGFLSATTLGAAMLIFGASGLLARAAGLPEVATYVIAAAVGLATAVIAGFIVRSLSRSSAQATAEYSLVGASAIVTSEVNETGGEVSVDDARESGRRLATSAAVLTEGSRVRIIAHTGHRVRVAPYID